MSDKAVDITTYQRVHSGYVPLTKEMRDEEAETRGFFNTYEEARQDAEKFDKMITVQKLRDRWLPQRIVRIEIKTVVTIEAKESKEAL